MTEALPQYSIIVERRVVPNIQPVSSAPYRIAIVGEAPNEDEENHGYPFVGKSGNFLTSILHEVGINRNACLVANVCQVRPPGNEVSRFPWDGPEIQSGLAALASDLESFNPNICLLLGSAALKAAKNSPANIAKWRGSLFVGDYGPFAGRKCVASLHPKDVLRDFEGFPLLKFDCKRALDEGTSPVLSLPQRDLITHYPASTLIDVMDSWPSGLRCSLDIEGGLPLNKVHPDEVKKNAKRPEEKRRSYGWPCVSICGRPTHSITIAWTKFSASEHALVLKSFARLMFRTDVPKVLQNSLYDNFVLSFGYGIPIRNVVEDTMLKGWEVYCELPKGLGTQASIWTREPFYKAERKSGDLETFYRYCAKDSAVTLEICNAQDSALDPAGLAHYRKNVEMLNPLLFMELRGINYNHAAAQAQLTEVKAEYHALGKSICETAGRDLLGPSGSLSSTRLAKHLYESAGYPPQYKKENGRKTDKYTTDVEALLVLRRKLPTDSFLGAILRHRHLEGIAETLSIYPDPDGRVRCGYNVVGTDTGRLTCYTSPTGAGANLQTITKKLRKNYRADPGYDFFQCDLAGADGWTVASHTSALGDQTMLNDYYSGLKPAKIIAMLYLFGADVNRLSTDDLLFWSSKLPFSAVSAVAGEWVYDGSKVVQHGTNYLMGIPTMISNLLKRSFKETGNPIYLPHSDAAALQRCYLSRYPGVQTWHRWCEAQLVAKGTLTSASGHTRIFFGRRFGADIRETLGQYLADEPQQNTTWSTNLAMLNLWNDPDNRRPDGSLIIEPLHQVHDALCGQWPQCCRDWARRKVASYFNNPLTIAGRTITIPFEGTWGPSWGDQPNKL